MEAVQPLTPFLFIAMRLDAEVFGILSGHRLRLLVDLHPDAHAANPLAEEAGLYGLDYLPLPLRGERLDERDADALAMALERSGPAVLYGAEPGRLAALWALAEAPRYGAEALLEMLALAGFESGHLRARLQARRAAALRSGAFASGTVEYDVIVAGAGAAGCAVTASLLKRAPFLKIAVLDPSEHHYYQPGWTLVGAGIFDPARTLRPMRQCIPERATWIRQAVRAFDPLSNRVLLADGSRLRYRALAVCTGLELAWDAVEGLRESLGQHGVTSNYAYSLAPYTWRQVRELRRGTALFTQPPIPIKCAGAPQKAMYLSCDWWRRQGILGDIQVDFRSAGNALFSVEAFVPPLMRYVKRYGAHLHFGQTLVAVDGPARRATFRVLDPQGGSRLEEQRFDLLHAVPPQRPPECVRASFLANPEGWLEVDPYTLQHPRFANVFGLGDIIGASNAKTAAAVRKQAPVVAENLLRTLADEAPRSRYDGYGACPLTVERGRVVLAEFGYGGRLLPSFPGDPRVPRRSAWALKTRVMPRVYFDLMLKGREWLAASREP